MFEIIFTAALVFYFVQTFIFIIGIKKKYTKLNDDKLPSISVVVAARNEEENIIDCLKSLEGLIYPEEKIEILIVDDNSTDATGELVNQFVEGKSEFKSLRVEKKHPRLSGKAGAIAYALNHAKGEVIITTDADCVVSPTWAKTLASHYNDGVAMVCGYTTQYNFSSFTGMQEVDFIYLLGVAAGAMNLGKPLSCIGNNMSFRKSVYDEVGGYESIPFSVTEDFKLLMTIHDLKKYKIIYPLDSGGLVYSKPCEDLKSLYWQKKRWGVGGLDSDLAGFSVMAAAFVTHIAILLIPFFYSPIALYLLLLKIAVDYFFLYPLFKKLKLEFKIKNFISFEIYLLIYVLVLPLLVIFNRKVKWKGREY